MRRIIGRRQANQSPEQSVVPGPALGCRGARWWYAVSLIIGARGHYCTRHARAATDLFRQGKRSRHSDGGGKVNTGGIDISRIEAMMAQLKAAASAPHKLAPEPEAGAASGVAPLPKLNFADALKASLDSVSAAQQQSEELGKAFAMGDDKVSLSDVMISMQKSSISFQSSIQVRNKLVSAYHEIMNMQV
jgi:flagellar hook-basal body complex protein FliE